ncbi:DHH family phosphoesterase [Candidatus Woesearchaeota archaeon]|jgi:single-stranded DNA-specific DHH superfamily exonuclease|nr:DHH family phosphoesterase [Candidatus Woesearchaeota archaeon]MBT5740075.1 DHH family phosphoesterase [Candidatus Woesearchaeota archaeon]
MLTDKEVNFLREELETAKNPLYFYDTDPDGLCSFLLLYRVFKEGKGILIKGAPTLDDRFLRKVEEYQPDKIVVLDKHMIEQSFVNKAKRPVFWIDHHDLVDLENVHYFNPKKRDPDIYMPTSRMAYQISNDPEDLWMATVGCLADYHMPNFIDAFIEQYPHLLKEKTDLPTALYKRPIGVLVRVFYFLLKGPTNEVRKSINILTRIKDPDEIMKQTTPQGKFLWKRFQQINEKYKEIYKDATKKVTSSKLLLYKYDTQRWSFTVDLANELACRYPKKVIIIARRKEDEMRCSLRAKFTINKALARALEGIEGRGGGHPEACGAGIKIKDWDRFLENFKRELK